MTIDEQSARVSPAWAFCGAALAVLLIGTAAASPSSTPVPQDILRYMKIFAPRDVSVEEGVLRVTTSNPVVRTSMFLRSMYQAYCMPVWNDPKKSWGGRDLKRIEVLNSSGAQGFAFVGGKKECMEAGSSNTGSVEYVKQRTWVCVASNPCRPRRPGEVTAADE